ncbi:Transcription factor MYC/MYB N-terminal [Dillenia turbinata]|uniref:Transcription factor MYC/MYB N-terminal n=1 Tax=Dillenia turbinata TaxID=194707 RepID=A0AAN8VBZ1_9MAGN
MGFLLKEALKSLCGLSRWSYAVFWKIGCRNPKLLIWEECYFEQPTDSGLLLASGTESPDQTYEEWERCWVSNKTCIAQIGGQSGDRVSSLINKMMMGNQINPVGEGIVGRAAFTGNHQWILLEHCSRGFYPPEVLNEMHHQSSAGMQTVAVIPILPHGVVQLGSSFLILENMGFVNDVKSLILRLGCVPGALLSDEFVVKESTQKIGVPVHVGTSITQDNSVHHKATNSLSFTVDNGNKQGNLGLATRFAGHPSHSSVRQIENNMQSDASTFETSCLIQTLPKPFNDHSQQIVLQMSRSELPYGGHLCGPEMQTEADPLNLDGLHHTASQYSSRSYGLSQTLVNQADTSCGSLRSVEQQSLLDAVLQNCATNHLGSSSSIVTAEVSKDNISVPNNHKSSVTIPLHGLPNGTVSNVTPVSIPQSFSITSRQADNNISCSRMGNFGLHDNGSSEVKVAFSKQADSFVNIPAVLGDSGHRFTSISENHSHPKLEPGGQSQKRMEKHLPDAGSILLMQPDELIHSRAQMTGFLYDSKMHKDESESLTSKYSMNGDSCVLPSSGDDLFDILGVDFKNKLFCGYWNNVLVSGCDGNFQSICKDASTTLPDAGPDVLTIGEVFSDSGIFCGSGTDHLLDAVISKVHSVSKQNSDDNESCRTTLTKVGASSLLSTSPTYSRVSMPMSGQMQGESFGIPKPLVKAGAAGSSSFGSTINREEAGNCSQSNSLYASHISSWVEQGNNLRCDSSVSTGYSKRPDEINKPNRKRLRPGENPRPRPKDRQMIQDRVKELREIVPNGAKACLLLLSWFIYATHLFPHFKCSIDALLERTIKHMLFLQSVTKHADKLKQTGESKIVSKEGGLLLKDNFEGGATWAYEVGSQSVVCPIIIEDLNPPRQMLVEMLCEERGFFLEIADIIRHLGLTILKGVMEARNDKIWARFAVEANRDIPRMEIFISLVQLLEQTMMSTAPSTMA